MADSLTPGVCVDVVICVYTDDRWDQILAAVGSVVAQAGGVEAVPLIAVDHNPELATRLRCALPDARVLENNGPVMGLSATRNAAILGTERPFVAFLDDDAVARPDWLAVMSEHFSERAVAVVGSFTAPDWQKAAPRWWPAEFNWTIGCCYRGLPETTTDVRNVFGCNMIFRRSSLEKAGMFHPGMGRSRGLPMGGEETEISLRITRLIQGARIVYEPGTGIQHFVPTSRGTLRYLLLRSFAEGISKARLRQLSPGSSTLTTERNYARKTLPLGVARGVRDALRLDWSGLGRSAAIICGLGAATTGYVVGRVRPNHWTGEIAPLAPGGAPAAR